MAHSLLTGSHPQTTFIPFSRSNSPSPHAEPIPDWISLVPIWALSDFFPLFKECGAKNIVALSSTSVFTKAISSDVKERQLVENIVTAENNLLHWGDEHSVRCRILRPTLIYGYGMDRNVSRIARLINRFGIFPLFGAARGLRQPIHADDVALACLNALDRGNAHSYNISGGETLSYREMVCRIFAALGRKPRLVSLPLWLFHAIAPAVRLAPQFRDWSPSMAERMNQDLVFDNSEVKKDLEMKFRAFKPMLADILTDSR